MRYRGGSVGHLATREYTHQLELDSGRDQLILPKYDENGELEDSQSQVDEFQSESGSDLEVDLEAIVMEEEFEEEEMDSDSSDESEGDLELDIFGDVQIVLQLIVQAYKSHSKILTQPLYMSLEELKKITTDYRWLQHLGIFLQYSNTFTSIS